jgi:uncharacterized protein (TIGR02594 family)
MTRADQAIDFALKDDIEGGYVNHPEDNGGPTNMGITLSTFRAWRNDQSLTKETLRDTLTKDEAQAIYKDMYWDKVRGDELPPGIDLVVFDGAVNSGPGKSIKLLQHALGVSVDGILGPITLWEVKQADAKQLVEKIIDIRLAWLKTLSDWRHFGRGWTNRLLALEEEALKSAETTQSGVVPRMVQDPRLKRAFRLAKSEVGVKEIPGSQHNERIVEYGEYVDLIIRDDETAWCATFVGFVLYSAGLEGTRSAAARSYMQWGEETKDPQPGDLAVFWRVARNAWQGHVGFVVEVDKKNNRVLVLSGNQDNMVNEKWYPMNGRTLGLLGYRTMRVKETVENPKEPIMEEIKPRIRIVTRYLVGAALTWLGLEAYTNDPQAMEMIVGAVVAGIGVMTELWYGKAKREGGAT